MAGKAVISGGRYMGSLHCKRYEEFKHVQEVLGK